MNSEFIKALQARRKAIRDRWEEFMRLEPVPSALSNPDTLAFGIDWTLDEILAHLRQPQRKPAPAPVADESNPLWAYYRAGEQALLEALVLIQADRAHLEAGERDAAFAELRRAIRMHAREEMEALAGVARASHAH